MKKLIFILSILIAMAFPMTNLFAQTQKVPSKKGTYGIVAPTNPQSQKTPANTKTTAKQSSGNITNGQTNFGPWVAMKDYNGIQARIRNYASQINDKTGEPETSFFIQFRNTYGRKVGFCWKGFADNSALNSYFTPDLVERCETLMLGAGEKFGDYTFKVNKANAANAVIIAYKVTFGEDFNHYAKTDSGGVCIYCQVRGKEHDPYCSNFINKKDQTTETKKLEDKSNADSSPNSANTNTNINANKNPATTNQSSNLTAESEAKKDGKSVDELKRKIVENLNANIRDENSDGFHIRRESISEEDGQIKIVLVGTIDSHLDWITHVTFLGSFEDSNPSLGPIKNESDIFLHLKGKKVQQVNIGNKSQEITEKEGVFYYNAGNNNSNFNELFELVKTLKSLNGKSH